jgi:hypothetical protein
MMLASSTSSTEQAHARHCARRGTRIIAPRARQLPGMYKHGRAPRKGEHERLALRGEGGAGGDSRRPAPSSLHRPPSPHEGHERAEPSTCSTDCLAAPAGAPHRFHSSSALPCRAARGGQGPGSRHDGSKRALPVAPSTRLPRRRAELNWTAPRGILGSETSWPAARVFLELRQAVDAADRRRGRDRWRTRRRGWAPGVWSPRTAPLPVRGVGVDVGAMSCG